jgi:predicted transcriptional regulator
VPFLPDPYFPQLYHGGLGGEFQRLALEGISRSNTGMSAAEVIEQFKALPPEERAEVTKYVVEHDDSWIPEDFKQGMADAEAGRIVDMEIVMSGAEPPLRDKE